MTDHILDEESELQPFNVSMPNQYVWNITASGGLDSKNMDVPSDFISRCE
jgi:hypothetical protein